MSLTFSVEEGITERKIFLQKLSQLKKELPTQRNRRSELYYNIPAAFDIETTSFYLNNSNNSEDKRALMYHWQFGVWNLVTAGRTWEELLVFLDAVRYVLDLSSEQKLIVYVHNLPYEFQWMRKRMEWDKVFLLDERKPVYAESDGIEFRDMLKLAGGRSLANVAKDLSKYKVEKMVGDLDYSVIRTPKTKLTKKELKYCENDIRVCLSYIQEKIEQDGGVMNIPLTNTGYVRKYCRSQCFKRRNRYRRIIENLVLEPDEYQQLKAGFQGGFTHANSRHVRKVLDSVGSFDLASAYPANMVLRKFPMSKATLVDQKIDESELRRLLYNYCCLFDITLTGVQPKLNQDHPISKSKCTILEGGVVDNGRVAFADKLKTTVTEQDFFIIDAFYKWDAISYSNFRYYEKQYLPKPFVLAILSLFNDKTKLKGIAEMAVEYMISKNMLNAAYGMTVTDIVRKILEYIDEDFLPPKNPDLASAIERYNADLKRFLFYPWGVWVTAYCRSTLFSAILACGNDYVYADTDSVKILSPESHMEYFDKYNANIMKLIEESAEFHHIDPELFSPVDQKGRKRPIGIWENEGVYDKFKTLGAKRYLVEKDGEFTLTVAGTNKKKSCEYLVSTGKPFEMFDNKLRIPPEATGKLLLKYIDYPTEGWIVDKDGEPYYYSELSSIHMENAEYNLSLADEFVKYLEGVIDFGE